MLPKMENQQNLLRVEICALLPDSGYFTDNPCTYRLAEYVFKETRSSFQEINYWQLIKPVPHSVLPPGVQID